MIDTIVFDMGNVLIEWNAEKVISHFEQEPTRQEYLFATIFSSGIWESLDRGQRTLEQAIRETQA